MIGNNQHAIYVGAGDWHMKGTDDVAACRLDLDSSARWWFDDSYQRIDTKVELQAALRLLSRIASDTPYMHVEALIREIYVYD